MSWCFFENNRLTSISWCCTMARQKISNIRSPWLVKPACAKDFCMIKSKLSFPSKWLLTVYIVSCDKLWSTWRFLPFKKNPFHPLVSQPGAAFFCRERYLLIKPRINCREVGETTATIWTKLWSFDNRKCGWKSAVHETELLGTRQHKFEGFAIWDTVYHGIQTCSTTRCFSLGRYLSSTGP